MTTTFTNARLINPETGSDEIGSLTIDGGMITALNGPEQGEVIDCGGKCLAPGIVDIGGVKIGEPGERHKESFRTAGAAAAAGGGVTTMVIRPDTTPPAVDTPETLEFVTRRAGQTAPVNVHSMAALTKGREGGREMVEVGFLQDAGAVAFTDCDHVIQNPPKTFARAMTYAKSLGALVVAHPQDPTLSDGGAAVTSGKFASLRGLPAVSPMAERMGLERDLALVEMTGASYHADSLSSATALPVLERAKPPVGCHRRGGQHPPPDAERAGRGRLSHLLQTQTAAAQRRRPAGHGRSRRLGPDRRGLLDAHAPPGRGKQTPAL